MELYLHVPFCRQKCRYCDFASYAGCESQMEAYVSSVLKEAEYHASKRSAMPVETVFLGGGTPSLLPAEQLHRLLEGVFAFFPPMNGAEFTSEANPGTLTPTWLETAIAHGMNRLSMGMQAYQPELLQRLGRIHAYEDVVRSVKLARDAGISNISLDLMFGLPGQTEAHWRETLHAALDLQPQHISCYGLIPEEGTPLKADLDAGRLRLPTDETERAMYDEAIALLQANGFQQYEISNFAQPGYACKHNLGYWQQVPYLGLGASASSMLPLDHDCAYTRLTNPSGLKDYLHMAASEQWNMAERIDISHEEARFETMMLGLRTNRGVSEEEFLKRHHVSLAACYGDKLATMEQEGLLRHEKGFWRLTRRGMDVQNAILVELMDE